MKSIFLKLMILFMIAVIPVVLFNYYIDPYGIFKNTSIDVWYELGREPNQHFAKMRHLLNDKHSWDSFLFGASRVGKVNPELIPGGNYYNMNYSEGLPGEHLVDIKVLKENGIPVKNVMIGLDNFSYTMRPEDHYDQRMRHPYEISDVRRYIFQFTYLLSVPHLGIINNLRSRNSEYYLIHFNILGNGMQNLERIDRRIEGDIQSHLSSERFRRVNIVSFGKEEETKYLQIMDETIQDVIDIIKLSREYEFNLYLFLNPTGATYYLKSNPHHFMEFKKKLARVTDYWDFSGLNTINTDNYYFYETAHYRTMVGDLMVCRMTGCEDLPVPDDFGVYVTGQNIDAHIAEQKEQLRAYMETE